MTSDITSSFSILYLLIPYQQDIFEEKSVFFILVLCEFLFDGGLAQESIPRAPELRYYVLLCWPNTLRPWACLFTVWEYQLLFSDEWMQRYMLIPTTWEKGLL